MSKNLTCLVNLLNDNSTDVNSLLDILSLEANNIIPDINQIKEYLNSLSDNVIPNDFRNTFILVIENLINQIRKNNEDEFNGKLLSNSYTHYEEILTSDTNAVNNPSIISNYSKDSTNGIEYHVIHPKLPLSNFKFGFLNVSLKVDPLKEISYITDEEKKIAVYEFSLEITSGQILRSVEEKIQDDEFRKHNLKKAMGKVMVTKSETANFDINFRNINFNSLFSFIGMPYISSKMYRVENLDSRAIIHIDTKPFFLNLINCYNSYYSSVLINENNSLADLRDIGYCYVDTNGLFLVSKMFILSTKCIDGDISTYFPYSDDNAINKVDVIQKIYNFSVEIESNIISEEMRTRLNSFYDLFQQYSGLSFIVDEKESKNGNIKHNIKISQYDQLHGDHIMSEISQKLAIEDRIASALRTIGQIGIIAKSDYSKTKSSNVGSDLYIFVDETSTTNYLKSVAKIYFNRSSFMTKIDESKLSNKNDKKFTNEDIMNNIVSRNLIKQRHSNKMLEDITKNNGFIRYKNNLWPNTYSNWIPTSIIPIFYEKKVANVSVVYSSITFVPFGFMKYTTIESILDQANSGIALYGIDFIHNVVNVERVIKISSNINETPNIMQIIVKSKTYPTFDERYHLPIKIIQIDNNHYNCLFKVSNHDFLPVGDIEWWYASNYSEIDLSNENKQTKKYLISLTEESVLKISQSKILRYVIENINIEHPFIESLLAYEDEYCDNMSIEQLILKQKEGKIDIHEIPIKFFELLNETINLNIEVTPSILDYIANKLKMNDKSWLNVLKTFFKSIQNPIRNTCSPIYNQSFENLIFEEMAKIKENISRKIFENLRRISNLDSLQQYISEFYGIERWAANFVFEGLQNKENIEDVKRNLFNKFDSLTSELHLLQKFYGTKINFNFITYASKYLNPEVFNQLIKIIYSELSVNNFENDIIELISNEHPGFKFTITQKTSMLYNINCEESAEEILFELNGRELGNSGLIFNLENQDLMFFDNTTFNCDIHCMFNVTYDCKMNLKDVILSAFKQKEIFYSTIGSENEIKNLNNVSIFSISEIDIETGKISADFFLPFNYLKGRITINSKEWNIDCCEFSLKNQTLEVEMRFNTNDFNTDEEKIKYENVRKNLIDFVKFGLIEVNESSKTFIYSYLISLQPVKMSHLKFSESFYLFTENLKEEIVTNSYGKEDDLFQPLFWDNISKLIDHENVRINDVKINIFLHPVASSIVKYYCKFNSAILCENYDLFRNQIGKKLGLKKIKAASMSEIFINFIENIDSYFEKSNNKSNSSNNETLIISNSDGIYTIKFDDLSIERKKASLHSSYEDPNDIMNSTAIKKITSIDEKVIKNMALEQTNIRREKNTQYNLSLATKNIKWDTMKLESYKFFRNEKVKWVKFSPSKEFMAIGFETGVKIYIRVDEKYVFCTNLTHENVRDIIFSTSKFCITLQYEDSSRPFAFLWIIASGIKVNKINLKYYTITTGDYVVGKYNQDGILKTTKPGILETRGDKNFINGKEVDLISSVSDYNKFFFSPKDSYLLFNRDGTFYVYDLNNFTLIKFKSINGISFDDVKQNKIYAIDNGSWNDDETFIGYTIIPLSTEKIRIVLDMKNLSITQSTLNVEYPEVTVYKNIMIENSSVIHPLYSYLMSYKESQNSNFTGIWIYNLFITFEYIGGLASLIFLTNDGMSVVTQILSEPDEDESKLQFLHKICQYFEYEVKDDYVKTIKWFNMNIFDYADLELSHFSNNTLSYIDGNYFSIKNDTIYIWTYINGKTELTHLDSHGYEKFLIDDIVIVLVTDIVEFAIIYDGFLLIKQLNTADNVLYDVKTGEYSSVKINFEKQYNSKCFFRTEVQSETYNMENKSQTSTIDSKKISGSMCLNRYFDYTLKDHSEISSEKSFQHGNLLVIINGREVKIVPKSVQIPKKIDGFNLAWYNDNDNEDWDNKLKTYEEYLALCRKNFPAHYEPTNVKKFTYKIQTYVLNRTSNTIGDGLNAALTLGVIDDNERDLLLELYNLTENYMIMYKKDEAFTLLDNFWANQNKSDLMRVFKKKFPERDIYELMDRIIDILSYIYGNIFNSVIVERAFQKIAEVGTYTVAESGKKNMSLFAGKITVVRKLEEIKELFQNILNAGGLSDQDIKIIKLIFIITDIPINDTSVYQIKTPSFFFSRLSLIVLEIKKINIMRGKSNFETYKANEENDLRSKYMKFLKYHTALNSKLFETQSDPDFITILKTKPQILKNGDEYNEEENTYPTHKLKFNKNGECLLGYYYYYAIDEYDFQNKINGAETYYCGTSTYNENTKRYDRTFDPNLKTRLISEYMYNQYQECIFISDETYVIINRYRGDVVRFLKEEHFLKKIKDDYSEFIEVLFSKQMYSELTSPDGSDNNYLERIMLVLGAFDKKDNVTIEENFGKETFAGSSINEIKIEGKTGIEEIEKAILTKRSVLQNMIFEKLQITGSDYELIQNQLIKDLLFLHKKIIYKNIDTIKKFILDIYDIRYNTCNLEESDFLKNTIIFTYNQTIPLDEEFFKMYNIPYVEEKFTFYSKSLTYGRFVQNGTYNDEYKAFQESLTPFIWKYRNGCSDDYAIPVLCFKFTFDSEIDLPGLPEELHDESKDIILKYKIPKDNQSFGVEYGTVKINLENLIMSIMGRNLEIKNKRDIMYTKNIIENNFRIMNKTKQIGIIDDNEIKKQIKFLPSVSQNNVTINSMNDYMVNLTNKYLKSTMWMDESISKFNQCSIPYVNLEDFDVDYIFDYSFDGIDFSLKHINISHVSEKLTHVYNDIVHNHKPIVYSSVKYTKINDLMVNSSDKFAILDFINSGNKLSCIISYGNCFRKSIDLGFIILTDTLSSRQYTFVLQREKEKYSAVIENLTYDGSTFTLTEKYEGSRFDYEKGRKIADYKEKITTFNSLDDMLRTFTFINDSIDKDEYFNSTISNITTKSINEITISFYNYNNHSTGCNGSVVNVFAWNNGVFDRIHCWNFLRYEISNLSFNDNKVIIVGTFVKSGSNIIRIGEMNIFDKINNQPISILSFDKSIELINNECEILEDSFISVGQTSYVVFNTSNKNTNKNFTDFLIIKDNKHMEKKFINNKINSMNVSKESGYVSLYFGSSDISEIWDCNFNYLEQHKGICDWM